MFQTSTSTTVVSSTDLKRQYQKVKQLLDQHQVVIVTNRNSDEQVDGVLIPYSPQIVEHLEDLLEDMEIVANKKALDRELLESLQSAKGKRVALNDLKL